jgi:SET domain-containing protein
MLQEFNQTASDEVRRVTVRKSSVHGRGLFALQAIPARQRILEYRGEVTSWRRASARFRRSGTPGHTFIFGLADGRVIDGSVGGNSARWLNHSCQPNCEAVEDEPGRIFIETIRAVKPGDELCIAYGLVVDEAITPELAADYACRCGAKRCTGSMLARVAPSTTTKKTSSKSRKG